LHTQSRVASSLLASVTQEVQSVRDKQFTHGNTHVPQEAVLFSKNPALHVQLGEFSLFVGHVVHFVEDTEQVTHLNEQG